jgi:hypothetical protein
MKYDDASWHSEAVPIDVPPDHGATHIGTFFGWALTRGLVGEAHLRDPEVAFDLDRIRDRHLRPRDFVLNWCDGRLGAEDLNEEGNAFAQAYYAESYMADWTDLHPEPYRVDDTWHCFDRMVAILDWRFDSWREGKQEWHKAPLSSVAVLISG